MTVWSERFAGESNPLLHVHGDSFPFDRMLLDHEIRASIAHVGALEKAAVLSKTAAGRLRRGLRAIARDAEKSALDLSGDHEDVHSFVEAELGVRVGALAGKLHTARSRNDQVATIYRLWLRERIDGDSEAVAALALALVEQAEANRDAVLPAYTHLQRAQPVLLAHHLLAHAEALLRDRDRLLDARRRVNVLPLGAGAGTGVGFRLDRTAVARELGFDGVSRNSLDAVSDRDFLAEYLAAAAILGTHLSRLAEEIVLWTSREFAFARLDDSAATGSSIMPQKRNPDGAELVRGKAGPLVGHLVSVLTSLKGLPLSYNKDLQECGAEVLQASGQVRASLDLAAATIAGLSFDAERMARALEGGFAEATELADRLAAAGVPFREAHGVAARLVSEAEARGLDRLADLPDETIAGAHPKLDPSVRKRLDPRAAIAAKDVIGGTAPRRVAAELRRMRKRLT